MTFGTFEQNLADRYRFDAELGRGAMGTVYRGMDLKLGRLVAIKVLDPLITNDLTIARFTSEISIAAGFRHPNIIGIHDSGEADGHLYYVMDYLGGETLRARLEREKQLSIDDTLKITKDVAEGLQYAHDRGVVHRDIKPENILLAEGRACILDFGLAIAMSKVETDRLTARGLSVGTPSYMSPEQAAGERVVGPAADQYALACVVYEMLVGEPPFTGPTATSIALRHLTEKPVPPSARRLSTPSQVNAAIVIALEKIPADRYTDVASFLTSLSDVASSAITVPNGDASAKQRRLLTVVAAISVVFAASALATKWNSPGGIVDLIRGEQLDTTRYLVAVPDGVPAEEQSPTIEGLRTALARWTGVTVVGNAEQQKSLGDKTKTIGVSVGLARRLRAGRVITVVRDTETRMLSAELIDAKTGLTIRRVSGSSIFSGRIDSAFSQLAYALLFDGPEALRHEPEAGSTNSRTAFADFLRGQAFLRTWALPSAESAFVAATSTDPEFASALLALAQTRSWERDAADIDGVLQRAHARFSRLTPSQRLHVNALLSSRSGRFHESCVVYDELLKRDSSDFAAWLGLGDCNTKDEGVIRNSLSRTGHSFRASLHQAETAYQRAFDLIPKMDGCCVHRADQLLRRPLFVSTTRMRFGSGVGGDTATYGAYPEWSSDTIAFVPVPIKDLNRPPPATYQLAIESQRARYLELATSRAAQSPANSNALEELADAMDLRARPAAMDTLRRARELTKDPEQAARLATFEIWARTKWALPDNLPELRRVRALSDSLLRNISRNPSESAIAVASVAALVGDADAAAQLAARAQPREVDPAAPPEVRGVAWALLAYAAVGGSIDSLRAYESRVQTEIENAVIPQRRPIVRSMWLGRALVLAFPVYRGATFSQLDTLVPLVAAEAAYARRDERGVRRTLASSRKARSQIRPADLTFDALFPQAWLSAAIGDTVGAFDTINPSLDAIRAIPFRDLSSVVSAGSLVQAMCLRAQLSRARHDEQDARRWARAVAVLTDTTSEVARRTRGAALAIAR